MKIEVDYKPKELKAGYKYINYDPETKKTRYGLQLDPFSGVELQEAIDDWDEAVSDWRREILKGIDRYKEYGDVL